MSTITVIRTFRILMGFSRNTEGDLNNRALDVIDALTGNPRFPTLPVPLSVVAQCQSAFSDTITQSRKGGIDRTRLKKTARLALEDALTKIALFIQGEARHDYDALLSSGFEVMDLNRQPSPLDQPAILAVFNNVSGQLTVRGQAVLNGRMYKLRTSTDGGQTWTEWPLFPGARIKVLKPTVPGTVYTVEFCAVGGSTKFSPWSNPVTIMAT